MNQRDKLIAKMRNAPANIRFADIEALLDYLGFVLYNRRGSHCVYHSPSGQVLTLVRPHGGKATCHPADIKKLIKVLDL
jgi:predicted RNA binding protein YcfA (HicA-like mRNA interferase family)